MEADGLDVIKQYVGGDLASNTTGDIDKLRRDNEVLRGDLDALHQQIA